MGGPGSGRWRGYSRKTTVEECWAVTPDLVTGPAGRVVWRVGEQETGAIGYTAGLSEVEARVRHVVLHYTMTPRAAEPQPIEELVRLTATGRSGGGERWWFVCPLMVNGQPCGRRVAKLYLPPGGRYFGCRHCYDLTYTSAQEAHKYDRLFARIAADAGMPGEGNWIRRSLERRYAAERGKR